MDKPSAAVHKGLRYKCDICTQTFWNKGAIKSHKSSKHDRKSLKNYSTEYDWKYLVMFLCLLIINAPNGPKGGPSDQLEGRIGPHHAMLVFGFKEEQDKLSDCQFV